MECVVVWNCQWLFKLVVLSGYRVTSFNVLIADDFVCSVMQSREGPGVSSKGLGV